eukprot:1161291-Pelagomonas_calceolata.AAC.3
MMLSKVLKASQRLTTHDDALKGAQGQAMSCPLCGWKRALVGAPCLVLPWHDDGGAMRPELPLCARQDSAAVTHTLPNATLA